MQYILAWQIVTAVKWPKALPVPAELRQLSFIYAKKKPTVISR